MLKQDLLDCVHSKVRWYAVHQTKKVCFRLNPHLNGTEDLLGHVNDLQYAPDFAATRRLESEVYGENYGKRYPAFTICEMKEYKFWPFVAGERWRKCSSLRITPGSLLTTLVETYREMEKEEKILRYTTDVYEKAVTYKAKTCLKKSFSLISFESSSSSSTKSEKHDTTDTIEMMKISFTYYGLSVSHLKQVLSDSGIDDVTDEEIARQNPSVTTSDFCTPRGQPHLKDLVEQKSPVHFVASSVRLEQGPQASDDEFEITPRQRRASKKKFTNRQMCWPTNLVTPYKDAKPLNTILDPINRRIMLDRKQEKRLRKKRRIELHESLNKAIRESNKAYESWWLRQLEDPLMRSGSLFGDVNLSFFGNSWIIDKNFGSEADNGHKHNSNNALMEEHKRGAAAPTLRTTRGSRPPLYVPNFEEVDSWRCECAVCTGNLLHQVGGIGDVNPRTHGQEGKIANREDLPNKIAENEGKLLRLVTEQKTDERNVAVSSKVEVRRSSVENQNRIPSSTPRTKSTRKTKRKKSTEKSRMDPKIWWESVSTYTTPKWSEVKDAPLQNVTAKIPIKRDGEDLVQKVKVTYSFEKLRHLRTSLIRKNKSLTTSDRQLFISKPQGEIGSDDCSLAAEESKEALNMDALMAHSILYKRRPTVDRSRLKIKLPSLDTAGKFQFQRTAVSLARSVNSNSRFSSPEINFYSREDVSRNARIGSEKSSLFSITKPKCRDELYFLHCVPENFAELCLAALSEYIVRFEAVLTVNGFQRVESMTINRRPLCSYGEREDQKDRLQKTPVMTLRA